MMSPTQNLAGQNGPYSGNLIKVGNPDPQADRLGARLGGESRVKFQNDPSAREFDVVSDQFVAQTNTGIQQISSRWRNAAKATFEAAIQNGKTPYFHFEQLPGVDILAKLREYAARYGIQPVIDIGRL